MEETTVYVWLWLGSIVGTLSLVAALLWASKTSLQQAYALWRAVRGYRDAVVAAVDDPTDPVIRELARISSLPPALWSAFLTAALRALADGLDTVWTPSPTNNLGLDTTPEKGT